MLLQHDRPISRETFGKQMSHMVSCGCALQLSDDRWGWRIGVASPVVFIEDLKLQSSVIRVLNRFFETLVSIKTNASYRPTGCHVSRHKSYRCQRNALSVNRCISESLCQRSASYVATIVSESPCQRMALSAYRRVSETSCRRTGCQRSAVSAKRPVSFG